MWSRFVMSQVKHNSYFIVGMAAGLWLALALVPLEEAPAECAAAAAAPAADEFEPHREERPLGSGGAPAGRAVQRPRYYSTELGMRGSLMAGVLSSAEGLAERVPALNRSLARLQPALKFFVTASAAPHAPNVVGFTDTREMLRPFHALKYLADNYLEEYDFFFLVTDDAFVNARRLTELVSKLSVSQDIYMGSPAGEESPYCALEAGVLLSNSVLRAVHAELEWCVRNSYSPAHHENLGRCVLHAAHAPCRRAAQGERYGALRLAAGAAPAAAELAAAVTARPAAAADVPALHARAARAALAAGAAETRALRAALARLAARHPPGYGNASWPAGLRRDPGLAPPPPESRFHHLRWTLLNATHAFMPDEVSACAPHAAAHARALAHAVAHARAWAARAWPGARAELLEAARQWEPAAALRYRLLLRLRGPRGERLRLLEVSRALGAARLVPVRYVTEAARVALLLAVPAGGEGDALGFLERYDRLAQQDKNTQLCVVWVSEGGNETAPGALARAVRARGAELLAAAAPAPGPGRPAPARAAAAGLAALRAAAARAGPALLLLTPAHAHFNQDALNRVRMNTIEGESWFLPQPFARHSQVSHPAFRATSGTGRFPALPRAPLLAVHRSDLQRALEAWAAAGGAADAEPSGVLAAAALRCVRAPEPGAVLAPRPAPCGLRAPATAPAPDRACLRALAADGFRRLDLGQRNLLAQLLLETEAAA